MNRVSLIQSQCHVPRFGGGLHEYAHKFVLQQMIMVQRFGKFNGCIAQMRCSPPAGCFAHHYLDSLLTQTPASLSVSFWPTVQNRVKGHRHMQQRIRTLPVLHLSMMVGQQACNRHSGSISLELYLHAPLKRRHSHAYPSMEDVAACLTAISDLLRNSASTSCFNGVVNSGASVGRLLSSKFQSCCAVHPVPRSTRYRMIQMKSKIVWRLMRVTFWTLQSHLLNCLEDQVVHAACAKRTKQSTQAVHN